MKYALNEHFLSFQGEGAHMGRAAYFVRLQGCDQKCHFCDSAGTWHPDWKPAGVPLYDAETLAELVNTGMQRAARGAFVVLTGGEPALYDLGELITELHYDARAVHIETAGHRPLLASLDWVTLSPKLFAVPPLEENWARADEVKLICDTPDQLESDLEFVLRKTEFEYKSPDIWLHPEWSQRTNWDLLRAIVETVKSTPRTRAGYQLHKLFCADAFDPGARRGLVPLGGVKFEGSGEFHSVPICGSQI